MTTFEYVLLIFIAILLILIILILLKKNEMQKKENRQLSKQIKVSINNLNTNLESRISNEKIQSMNSIKNSADSLDNKLTNQNMEQLNFLKMTIDSLEEKIKSQNHITNNNVKEMITRVTSLGEMKNQINDLNININNLEKILNDKKLRGNFGEAKLLSILHAVYGENKSKIYESQKKLSNGKIVDFQLHLPYPIGDLSIDSKFPLENYTNIINSKTEEDKKRYRKLFKADIKKHINNISNKYIIDGETANQAMMFIPAETIFAYIYSEEESIVEYSYEKKVWITSPTTIMSILNLSIIVLKDIKRNEESEKIKNELIKLKEEFIRYETKWNSLNKHWDAVTKDIQDISVTSKKITKKFDSINEGEI